MSAYNVLRSGLPPVPTVGGTIGALEISILVCFALWGVLTTQVVVYLRNFSDDSWKLRYLVITLWFIEVFQCAGLAHTLYTVTITYYGNPPVTDPTPWSLTAVVVANAIIGAIAQSYTTLRIWLIAGYLPISILCWLGAIARLIGLLAIAVLGVKAKYTALLVLNYRTILVATMSLGGVMDVVIAAALCWSLWRTKSGFEDLSRIMDKITMSAIETGLLSGFLGIAIPITFAYAETTFDWIAIFLVLSKVFSNSLVASLNLREVYRKELNRRASKAQQWVRPRRTFPFLEPSRVEVEMSCTTVTIHDVENRPENDIIDVKNFDNCNGSIRFPPYAMSARDKSNV